MLYCLRSIPLPRGGSRVRVDMRDGRTTSMPLLHPRRHVGPSIGKLCPRRLLHFDITYRDHRPLPILAPRRLPYLWVLVLLASTTMASLDPSTLLDAHSSALSDGSFSELRPGEVTEAARQH